MQDQEWPQITASDTLLAVLVTFIWGFNFVVIRVGVDTIPPLMLSALRFLLAAVPCVFFLPRPRVSWRILFGVAFFLGVFSFGFLFVGISVGMPAGLASLALQSQAFFTALLAAALFQERIGGNHVAGMALAFLGLVVIGFTIGASSSTLGFLFILAAAFSWAVSNLLMKKAGQINMVSLMVWVSLIPPVPLFCLSLIFEGQKASLTALAEIDALRIGALLYLAYISTVLGFGWWGRLISRYGAGRIAPFSLLVPVFGMASSAILLGEKFGFNQILAGGLILLGLVLTYLPSRRGRAVASRG